MNERFPWAVWGKKGIQPSGTPDPYELIARSRDFNCDDLLREVVGKFEWNGKGTAPYPDVFVVSPVRDSAHFALIVRLQDDGADSMRRPHTLKAEAVLVSLSPSPLDAARKLAALLESPAWDGPPMVDSQECRALYPQPAEPSRIEAIRQQFTESSSPATLFVSAVGKRDCSIPPDWTLLNDASNTITTQTGAPLQTRLGAKPPVTSSPPSQIRLSFPQRGRAKSIIIGLVMLLSVGAGAWCWRQQVEIQQLQKANRQLSDENRELENQRDEIQAKCNELRTKSIPAEQLEQVRQHAKEASESLTRLLRAFDEIKDSPPRIEPSESDR